MVNYAAYEMDTLDISLQTAADLSSSQYTFVKISADNTVAAATAATDKIIGILQNKPKGDVTPATARVRVFGVSRLVAVDTSLTYGVYVTASTGGKGIATAADKEIVNGIVIQGATAANEIAAVLLTGPMTLSTA
jgi:hypothetical protein